MESPAPGEPQRYMLMIKYLKYIYPRFEWTILTSLSKTQICDLVKLHTKIDADLNNDHVKEDKDFLGEVGPEGFKLSRNQKSSYRGIAQLIIEGSFISVNQGTKLTAIFTISRKKWIRDLVFSFMFTFIPLLILEKTGIIDEFVQLYIYYMLPFIFIFSYLNFWYETLWGVSAMQVFLNEYRI